jgi:hypothetical protein
MKGLFVQVEEVVVVVMAVIKLVVGWSWMKFLLV